MARGSQWTTRPARSPSNLMPRAAANSPRAGSTPAKPATLSAPPAPPTPLTPHAARAHPVPWSAAREACSHLRAARLDALGEAARALDLNSYFHFLSGIAAETGV